MGLISADETSANLFTIEFSVDKETFDKAVYNVFIQKQKKIEIPGFRRGKAPRHIIETFYGKEYFYDDAINAVYRDAYDEALKEAGIEPECSPKLNVKEIKDGVVFTAEVCVKPKVKIENYFGIPVVKTVNTVTDEQIAERINYARQCNALRTDIDDRPAQEGDFVVINFDGFCDGEPIENGSAKECTVKLGDQKFIQGFEEQIVGHSVNDEFDINVTFPEDYHESKLAGKEATFKCLITQIYVEELPELNDDFASDVSEFDTFDEYKESIRKEIEEDNANRSRKNIDDQICDYLNEHVDTEIPEPMIKEEVERAIANYESQGYSLDQYTAYLNKSIEEFKESCAKTAKYRLRVQYALCAIGELENITVDDEEIESEYKELSQRYKTSVDEEKANMPERFVKEELIKAKVMKLLAEKANVTETSETKKDNADETPEKDENTGGEN